MATHDCDVLVIGAGWTGISAAQSLVDKGLDVQVLDQYDDHIGGRSYAFGIEPNNTELWYDHGAQYVGDNQNEIMALIQKHCPEALVNGAHLRAPYDQEVMILNDARYCYPKQDSLFGIGGVPPTIGFWDIMGMLTLLMEIEGIEQAINTVEPWNSPKEIQALDEITLEQWLGRPWISATAADLIKISVQALLSVEARQVSPFYLWWYTACNNGFLYEVNDNEGGPQQYWLSIGTSGLAEKVAAPIKDRIHGGVRVASVTNSCDGVQVVTADGDTWNAKKCIVAVSPNSAGKIEYSPAPPAGHQALFKQAMGKTIKCQVLYNTDWWHDSHTLQYDGYVGGANYPVLWVMDNSPTNDPDTHVLMTFTVGDNVPDSYTKEDIVKLVTEGIAFLFNDMRALATSDAYIDTYIYDWSPQNPYIQGGPNSIFTPGTMVGPDSAAKALNEGWDSVYFASSETVRKLDPRSKTPYFDGSVKAHMPQYTADAVLLPDSKAPFWSQYSDMRESLGYMDGGITGGKFVAEQVAKSLGKDYNKSIDAPVSGEAPVIPQASGKPPELTPEKVIEIMTLILDGLYIASVPQVEKWIEAGWTTDPEGLQTFLSEVIVVALVLGGQILDPLNPADIAAGLQNFCGAGLALFQADTACMDPAQKQASEDVIELTKVLNAVMQLKSAEPFITSKKRLMGGAGAVSGNTRRSTATATARDGASRTNGRFANPLPKAEVKKP